MESKFNDKGDLRRSITADTGYLKDSIFDLSERGKVKEEDGRLVVTIED